nr:DUF6703 family protein [Actinoplanes solisilvae]
MQPSDSLLRRLSKTNPTAAFVAALVVMLAGLFLPGIVGAALLFLLALGLALLTYTTWSVQKASTRVLRLIILALLLAVVVAKAI